MMPPASPQRMYMQIRRKRRSGARRGKRASHNDLFGIGYCYGETFRVRRRTFTENYGSGGASKTSFIAEKSNVIAPRLNASCEIVPAIWKGKIRCMSPSGR